MTARFVRRSVEAYATRSAWIVGLTSLLVLGTSCAPAAGGWANPEPSRSYSDDAARCEAEARAETLRRRGGEPRTLDEQQRFAAELRRGTDRCVRELGWRPAHGPRSGTAIALSTPDPSFHGPRAFPVEASPARHGRKRTAEGRPDG